MDESNTQEASETFSSSMSEEGTTPMTSNSPSECALGEPIADIFDRSRPVVEVLSELYAENIMAKALRTAQVALGALPYAFPEIVPQEQGHNGAYSLREADFWTCGFFPGTLYALLERSIKYPQSVELGSISLPILRNQLASLCRAWTEPIYGMDGRTDTHDIGFIVMPALRADWELFGNQRSLDSIITAARSLATRYVPSARAIRSWDLLKKKDIEIIDQSENMICIVDSLCNLDLLYYAAQHTRDRTLSDMATAHAETLLQSHLRPEPVLSTSKDVYRGQWYSSCHVANLDPRDGSLKIRLSAQGYAHDSTWSRGQAWGILGYAETYVWTKDVRFLEASCGMAEYFLYRLDTAPECVSQGRYVPLWDFDAPIENELEPLRDSSAGVIAANGMLILSQALASLDQNSLAGRFRSAAIKIVEDTLRFALAPEKAVLVTGQYQHIRAEDAVSNARYDGMLKFGTANNNVNARKRYANHGLVYGDYYLVEFGNRLLRMGLC
ncbi:unsaturated glucuronyl hydrolase [Paraphoma chrysanthemicola]|uniref:Unsaturated glucuronyl hydrolase n=1 Tax=Paraphoma chrysanthemicola TaxID=798071 RepID=A0A8K0QUT9_9PLEO|nr:unsaturated glucuronyl hydrolase [Paraphoma chrysanthemicola]